MQVAELDHPKRWSSWLSAAHSLRCFERKKTGWKENGSTSGPKSDLFCLSAFACLELTYERVSQSELL